jgi:hypothetical protein
VTGDKYKIKQKEAASFADRESMACWGVNEMKGLRIKIQSFIIPQFS